MSSGTVIASAFRRAIRAIVGVLAPLCLLFGSACESRSAAASGHDAGSAGAPGRCAVDLAAIRALRSGPQPCRTEGDCTVWHNGTYWDGCPVEVNVTNAARLDALRTAFQASGCTAVTGGQCAANAIRGCVRGTCGGT